MKNFLVFRVMYVNVLKFIPAVKIFSYMMLIDLSFLLTAFMFLSKALSKSDLTQFPNSTEFSTKFFSTW